MKITTILGVALLGVSAYVSLSCSSDDNNVAATTTGGQGGTAGTTAAAGSGPGGSGTAGSGTSAGTPVIGGYLTQGSLKGATGTLADGLGSTITQTPDTFCVKGSVIQVPIVNGSYNYNAWGVAVGYYLNQEQLTDGGLGDPSAADLSAFTKIVVAISGTTEASLRLQLEVKDPISGASRNFCAPLPATGTGAAGIALSSLVESCWQTGGAAFDPATMRPLDVSVAVLTDTAGPRSFDFCITQFVFQ